MENSAKRTADGGRLLVLDVFRAIAIIGVMAHHYLPRWAPPDNPINVYGYNAIYPQWLDIGALGVQFFFIISGFVIFMTLERCGHLFEFWLRRLARLYPAYIVCMVITFFVANTIGPAQFASTTADIPANMAFLTPFVPGAKFIEPAYWSLIIELQFYFWIGLIFAIAPRRFIAAWISFCTVALSLWMLGAWWNMHAFESIAKNILLVTYLPQFTFGMLCYRLHSGTREGAGLLAIAALSIYAVISQHYSVETHLAHVAMVAAFALFLLGKLNWLCIRPLLFVGAISYPLYLIHQYIGVSLIAVLTRQFGFIDMAAMMSAALMCGFVAFIVHQFVESPAKNVILTSTRKTLRALQNRLPSLALPTKSFSGSP